MSTRRDLCYPCLIQMGFGENTSTIIDGYDYVSCWFSGLSNERLENDERWAKVC